MIRYARCHCRGYAERLMAAAEVVMGEVQGDGRAVVFQLFAKPVRQTGEPAHGHAERQILPLDMGSADLRRIGVAADWDRLRTDDFGGAVPLFAFARSAIDLDEFGIIDAHPETVFDRIRVRVKTIAGKLETPVSGFAEFLGEGQGIRILELRTRAASVVRITAPVTIGVVVGAFLFMLLLCVTPLTDVK